MDGKSFAQNEMIIALGVTLQGEKVILGMIESHTENHRVCREFLQNLKERGLRDENKLLFIIDGAKGLRKGIQKVFGRQALVQRCQWHKREKRHRLFTQISTKHISQKTPESLSEKEL